MLCPGLLCLWSHNSLASPPPLTAPLDAPRDGGMPLSVLSAAALLRMSLGGTPRPALPQAGAREASRARQVRMGNGGCRDSGTAQDGLPCAFLRLSPDAIQRD